MTQDGELKNQRQPESAMPIHVQPIPIAPTNDACVEHRLRPLLAPRSMALVGVSPRQGAVGADLLRCVDASGFDGAVTLINPRHEQIGGRACLPNLAAMTAAPELVVLAVGAARIEQSLTSAARLGARAAVIFDACHGAASNGAALTDWVRDFARETGMAICGGNGMGYFNVADRRHASFYNADHLKPGGVALIAHSGSVFTVLALNDPRYRFSLAASPGQELGATLDEYMTFALSQPSTRAIALFMEGARDPEGFRAALEQAAAQDVPVVVCKVGRSAESARLALSHSGAMAGDDDAFRAVLERCGAIAVDSVDALMNTAMLLAQARRPRPGALGLVTDSGGLRELTIDRAASLGAPLAELSPSTVAALREALPAELTPSNPQDCAASISEGFETAFERAVDIFDSAPEVGLIGLEIDVRDDHAYSSGLTALAESLPKRCATPSFVYSSFSQTNNRVFGDVLADLGAPLINGLDATLQASTAALRWRDLQSRPADPPLEAPSAAVVEPWRRRLAEGGWIGEGDGLDLLAVFGVPVIASRRVESNGELAQAAEALGFPLALKTAAPGVGHKSDLGGVALGLSDLAALDRAYAEMSARLGPEAIVQRMAGPGVELAFGCVRDPVWGPLVSVAAGGALVEILDDRRFALAPFGAAEARRMIEGLRSAALLDGARGSAAVDRDALALALARFSALCATLADVIAEVDANPVIARPDGAVAVDALVLPTPR